MLGVHQVAIPYRFKMREFQATHSAVFQPFYQYGNAYSSGAWQRVTQSLLLPYMVRSGLLFQVVFHPVTQNLLWELNMVFLVWCLGVRLMNFPIPGGKSAFLLDQTSTLFSWASVNTNSLPTWTRVQGVLLFGPGSRRLWAWSWFCPHGLHQHVKN